MLNFSFQSANGIVSFISMFQIFELMGCKSNHQSLFNKVFFSKDVNDISIALVEYGSQMNLGFATQELRGSFIDA
jgi:hypothetical protein